MQTSDFSDSPPPPQDQKHRQYYGFLLPNDDATTWHKTYCQNMGLTCIFPTQYILISFLSSTVYLLLWVIWEKRLTVDYTMNLSIRLTASTSRKRVYALDL
ncbi:hypothetical protein BDQ12DRAFT_693647 [Crucibulum laeve]|uniref:Uncharacterized protein n=1 Tax=Crucibulum laeve TaxID=68775 RepID=A0A5C3LSI2_9AGAR|nr:hypothetical protein BDQ12DRAFT_693647 [Crucibulum laeve]